MAKKVYKISDFDGGINQRADARDIADNELASAFNVNVSNKGRITLTGNALSLWYTHNDYAQVEHSDANNTWYETVALSPEDFIINNGASITSGYGLFICSHDFTSNGMKSNDNPSSPSPQKSEFILLNDGAHIDLWDSCFNYSDSLGATRWVQQAITLGNVHSLDEDGEGIQFKDKVKPTYYKAEGGIRVCDGNFNEKKIGNVITRGGTRYHDPKVNEIYSFGGGTFTGLEGTYIRIKTEIMKIVSVTTATIFNNSRSVATVERGRFGTKPITFDGGSTTSNPSSDSDDIYAINVPKILKHVHRPMLENATQYDNDDTNPKFANITINKWIEDVQCLEAPERTHLFEELSSGSIVTSGNFGRGLVVMDGPVTSMAKKYGTGGSTIAQAYMHLYPNDKEKVLFSIHESNSATDSEHSLSQYEAAGGVGDVATVEITSLEGINWAENGFVTGKQVIISGTTEINGLADIVGTGSSASVLEITASMSSDTVTTTHVDGVADNSNAGMTARLESSRIDEKLQSKFVFGMSYMYEGGGGEMQESPIQMGYMHSGLIPNDASLCNIPDGWVTGTDADDETALLATAANTWYHSGGKILGRLDEDESDGTGFNGHKYLMYRASTSTLTAGDEYLISIDVSVPSTYNSADQVPGLHIYPPGNSNTVQGNTATYGGGIGGSTLTSNIHIQSSGTYLFRGKVPNSDGDDKTLFAVRGNRSVQASGITAYYRINSVQVFKINPTEMSATNAIDMSGWEGLPRFFSSFNMNLADEFSWNERISGYKIYMKQVDMATNILNDEWLLALKTDFASGRYANYTNASEEEPLFLNHDWDEESALHYKSVVATNVYMTSSGSSQLGLSDYNVMRNIPLETYESENQYSPDVTTTAMYKTSTVVNGKMFIGNLKIGGITYPDRMIEAPPFKFDTFPNDGLHNVDVALGDGDEIVHLESVNNKIIQFKRYTAYLLGVDSEDIDLIDTWRNMGILSPCQVVKAGSGIVWVNNNGLYYYDGEKVTNITGDKFSTENWRIGEDDALPPMLLYDASTNKVIIQTSNIYAKDNGGYILDMATSSIVEVQNVFKWYEGNNQAAGAVAPPDLNPDEINNNDNMDTSAVNKSGLDPLTGLPQDESIEGKPLPTSGSGREVALPNAFRSNAVVSRNKKILFATNIATGVKMEFHTWSDTPKYLHSFNNAASHFEIKTKDIDFGNPSRRKKIYKVYVTFKAGGYMSGVIMKYATNGSDSFTDNTFKTITGYDNTKGFDSFLGSQANSTDDWITVGLKPTSTINNIYSLQLKFEWANAGHVGHKMGEASPEGSSGPGTGSPAHRTFDDDEQPTIKLTDDRVDTNNDSSARIASSVSDYYNGMPLMPFTNPGYGWDYRIIDYGHEDEAQTNPSPNFGEADGINDAGGFKFWNNSLDANRRANVDRVANGLNNLDVSGFPSNEIKETMIGGETRYQLGHIPKQFEINDITIVYREKSIK